MSLLTLKRAVYRIGSRLNLVPPRKFERAAGKEMDVSYYDEAFSHESNYQVPFYESSYYSTWLVIVDRLRRYGCQDLLDIGCGPGQFSGLVEDWGFRSYVGLDFSPVAIKKAQERNPRYVFRVADACKRETYTEFQFDAVVCMEVLEHILEDFKVLSCIPAGKRCLMTVPNFPWKSHVRHFETEESVASRYGKFFDDFTVTRMKGTRSKKEQFFLLDGVRNTTIEENC